MSDSTSETWLETARQLRSQKRPLEGLQAAETGLQVLGDGDAELRARLAFEQGSCALALRDWSKAAAAFAAADGGAAPAALAYRRGRAAQELGLLVEAETQFRLALDAKAAYAKAWHQLARVLELQQRFSEAETAYRRALEAYTASQSGERGVSAYQLGRLCQARQAWSEAAEAFRLARRHLAAQAQLRAEACYGLSDAAIQLGEFAEAEAALSEAIGIHAHLQHSGGLGLCRLKLCQVLMLQRRWKEVVATVALAIQSLNQSSETSALRLAYELQAELFELLNRGDQAAASRARAAELN